MISITGKLEDVNSLLIRIYFDYSITPVKLSSFKLRPTEVTGNDVRRFHIANSYFTY